MSNDRLIRAEHFVWATARVLEQRRFQYLFQNADPDGVLAALASYETPDGGYGYALEPDGRGPVSQPLHVDFALRVLDDIGVITPATADRICGYLDGVSRADGGLPNVHPNIRDYPRAPWWELDESASGSLIPTANIAGLLHHNGIRHPWLDRATQFCWAAIDAIEQTHPYVIDNCIAFLDQVPDRERAEKTADRLGTLVRDNGLVALTPDDPDYDRPAGYAAGEDHYPYDYAATPESLARRWFSDAEFDQALDHLAATQAEDGGWSVSWLMWTPAVEPEWRGWATVRALRTLRSFNRL